MYFILKRVIIHSNTLWSLSNFRFDLIKALIEVGYEVICLAPGDDISSASESRLKSLNVEIYPIHIDRRGTNPFRDLGYLRRLLITFRQLKPDAVLLFTPKPNIYASIACRIRKIPYINTINGLGTGFLSGFPVATIMQQLYRIALKRSKKVFVQNHDDLNLFLEAGILSGDRSSFIPGSGVDINAYRNIGERKPESGALRFLYAGRLIKQKGIYDYLYLARHLKKDFPASEFWVVGFIDEGNPGSLTEGELNDLISTGLIEFKGKTDDIALYMNASDVIIFPSDRGEGLPRTLLEAASCSMPIITYDVPGCREIVREGDNGFLCENGNTEQLLDICRKILASSPRELIRLGENGRRRVVSEFSVEIVNDYYVSALKDLD